ncbi:MAG: sigma factor [Actinomycetota bacterium]
MTDHERLLDELRPVSFAIAYRMLGSVSEAQDVVQEALLGCIRRSRPASGSHRRRRSSPP